jgi:hypothetical protein
MSVTHPGDAVTESTQRQQLKITCEAVVRASKGVLHWGWDDYLSAALAVFPATDGPKVAALLATALPGSWDVATIASAPAPVKAQAQTMGGLRTGQRLFASHDARGALAFAAWWPWGDGKKVSLRVGVVCPGLPEAEAAGLTKELRTWFGI